MNKKSYKAVKLADRPKTLKTEDDVRDLAIRIVDTLIDKFEIPISEKDDGYGSSQYFDIQDSIKLLISECLGGITTTSIFQGGILPGPGVHGSWCFVIDDDEVDWIKNEIPDLFTGGLATIIGNELWVYSDIVPEVKQRTGLTPRTSYTDPAISDIEAQD